MKPVQVEKAIFLSPSMTFSVPFAVFLLLLFSFVIASSENDTEWSSTTLQVTSGSLSLSERAIGISALNEKSFLVAVERTLNSSSIPIPILYKTTSAGTIFWAREVKMVHGNPYDLAFDRSRGSAFLVVSSHSTPTAPYTDGHVVRFQDLSKPANTNNAHLVVSEKEFFSTRSENGHTKLFGCALDINTGELYVTGGTADNLYSPSQGKSDTIVVRISSAGKVLATAQFGTVNDEFGRAISVSADSSIVAVAVHTVLDTSGTESVLYRLNSTTLVIIDEPTSISNYAATPLFMASDITISGRTPAQPKSITVMICGASLTVPDRKMDVFLHLYTELKGEYLNNVVYIDGAMDEKRDDFAVSLKTGSDGNIYVIGYSKWGTPATYYRLVLFVLAPTGQVLYKDERVDTDRSRKDIPSAMVLFLNHGQLQVAFAGYTGTGSKRRAIIGTAFPPSEMIRDFRGFESPAEEPATGAGSNPANTSLDKNAEAISESLLVPIISGTVGGGLVLLIGIAAFAIICMKRRAVSTKEKEQGEYVASKGEEQPHLSF